MITPKVESFLRQVQWAHDFETLGVERPQSSWLLGHFDLFWIDAISINQSDDDERASQVSMMRDLYERSHSIFIWLGEARAHTQLTLDYLNRDEVERKDMKVEVEDCSLIEQEILELLRQPYWTRSWVLQEATTPKAWDRKVILCGSLTAPVTHLLDAAANLSHMLPGSPVEKLSRATNITIEPLLAIISERQKSPDVPLHLLLQYARSQQASDPRDTLFAPLQLAAEGSQFPPTYGIPKTEVYHQFARMLIENDMNVDILAYIESDMETYSQAGGTNLPSWVPDWTWTWASPLPFPRDDTELAFARSTWDHYPERNTSGMFDSLHSGILTVCAIEIGSLEEYLHLDHSEFRTLSRYQSGRSAYRMDVKENIARWFPSKIWTWHILTPHCAYPGDRVYFAFGSRYFLVLRRPPEAETAPSEGSWEPNLKAATSSREVARVDSAAADSYMAIGEAVCRTFSDETVSTQTDSVTQPGKNLSDAWRLYPWGGGKQFYQRLLQDELGDSGAELSKSIVTVRIT